MVEATGCHFGCPEWYLLALLLGGFMSSLLLRVVPLGGSGKMDFWGRTEETNTM